MFFFVLFQNITIKNNYTFYVSFKNYKYNLRHRKYFYLFARNFTLFFYFNFFFIFFSKETSKKNSFKN